MSDFAQTVIRARDESGPAWASAQKNAATALTGIRSMIPGLAAALSASGLVNLAKDSIDAMDRLNDLSKTTGLTVEALSGLKLAARQSGGDLDSIAASVNKLAVEMGKAPAKFRELGITAQDPLEAFKQLADIFNRLEDPQQRAAVAAAALGKSWQGAAPLLSEGSKKIGEMVEKGTKAAGITGDMARQADELNDKWLELVGSGGLVNGMVGRMLPNLVYAVDLFADLKRETSGLVEQLEKLPKITLNPSFLNLPPEIVMAARVLREGIREGGGGMRLGSGPPGGRASAGLDRQLAEDAAAGAAKKFLGVDKGLDKAKAEAEARAEYERILFEKQAEVELNGYKELEEIRKAAMAAADADFAARMAGLEAAAQRENEAAAQMQKNQEEIDERRKLGIERGKEEAFSLLSTAEQENLLYAERLTNLSLYLEEANLAQVDANALLAQLQLEHEAKLGSILADAAIKRRKFAQLNGIEQAKEMAGILSNLTASTASKNREMFELNKIASMANAIIYTYEGANKALSIAGPFGFGLAAAVIAAGLANVAQIASTSFGSGAAPSAGGGGAGVMPVNQVPTVPQGGGMTTFLKIDEDDLFSGKTMRKLADQMIEAQKKGGRFVLVD